MKHIILVAISSAFICAAADPQTTNTTARLPEITTKHREWKAEGRIRYRDEVYRGKERILQTVRFQMEGTNTWQTWRFFYIDGKAIMFEDDHGGVKPATISLLKDNVTYAEFTRQQDGSLKPLSSEDLAKRNAEEKKFSQEAESFTSVLATQIATNSTGTATQIIKQAVQEFTNNPTGKGKK